MQIKSNNSKNVSRLSILRWVTLFSSCFCLATSAYSATPDNLFFLHHSTGNGLITGGDMRGVIASYNTANGTSFAFWDHGYNEEGLRDPDGNETGTSYEIPNDCTNPDGLHYLWTSTESDATTCRNTIMANHQVIAFKSCFPASDIPDTDTLNQYKTWYLEMLSVFDQHPDNLFVVMSTPPLHRLATTSTAADNARLFANWLKSQEYLGGHTNMVCFDLFDELACTDNMLKYDYEGSHDDDDSHPNDTANQTVGPIFANFLIDSALAFNTTNTPTPTPTGLGTPTIRANGETNEVAISYPETVCITVEISAGESAGIEADWWVIAFAQGSGEWYYLDGNMEWMQFSGDVAECQSAYQGPLFNLASTTVLNERILPYGTFNFYFAVDQRDGILNYPAGPIEFNLVTVIME